MRINGIRLPALIAFTRCLAAAIVLPTSVAADVIDPSVAMQQRPCPEQLGALATCYSGRDSNGAWYLAAVPKDWNQALVVHAHGGPRLGQPKPNDSDEDLERFAIMVSKGYAWVGSTYRRGGYGVRMAAADVDNSRAAFWSRFGQPKLTILHGQSYGGNVAAKLAELHALDSEGRKLYDGVILTNGVLWGGTRAYGFRADLRAVYQYFCRNHPRPDEPQYPLWQGLPLDSAMTRSELELRFNECTGAEMFSGKRSIEQQHRLSAIARVTGINDRYLLRHLEWATFTFRDLVQLRLNGANPFDNSRMVYRGSRQDRDLNREIERFAADPAAVAKLAYDSDLSGQIVLPTITLHALHDPIVSAKADAYYGRLVAQSGNTRLLAQYLTNGDNHSRLSDAEVLAALEGLKDWIETKARPVPGQIEVRCAGLEKLLGQPCLFLRSTP